MFDTAVQSPRGRGNRNMLLKFGNYRRFIPAWAGQSHLSDSASGRC